MSDWYPGKDSSNPYTRAHAKAEHEYEQRQTQGQREQTARNDEISRRVLGEDDYPSYNSR